MIAIAWLAAAQFVLIYFEFGLKGLAVWLLGPAILVGAMALASRR
jgi:hypothetical protein